MYFCTPKKSKNQKKNISMTEMNATEVTEKKSELHRTGSGK